MNKAEFLNELALCLHKMDVNERNKFITYYDEMLSDYIENGIKEEEAVKKVGMPKNIANELLIDYNSVKIKLPSTSSKVINYLLIILGFPFWGFLLLSVIFAVISIYFVMWCVPFVTGVGSIGYLATSLVGIIGSPFIMVKSLPAGIMQLGTGIGSIGLSLILGFVTIGLYKKIMGITKRFNSKLVAFFKKKVVIK